MKFTDFLWFVVVAVIVVGAIRFMVWHSRQVEAVGKVLDEEYTIVCPEGEVCRPVKN